MTLNTSSNRDFQWTDELVAEFHRWIPKQPTSFTIDYSGLIDTFKSSRLSNGVEKESKYVAEAIGKDRMDIHKSPNAEWPEVLSLMIEDLSSQKNVGVDWEIQTFKSNKQEVSYPFPYQVHNGIWVKKTKWVEFWLNQKEYSIHSVRRFPDGVIFCVGDKIGWGEVGNYETTIIGFVIEDGRLKIGYSNCPGYPVDFLTAVRLHKKPEKPVPQPLFYTLNEEPIYIGDEFWVAIDSGVTNFTASESNKGYWRQANAFKSKGAAEHFRLMNSHCLSINDVKSMYADDRSFVGTQWLIEKLKDFAKSKINP